MHGLQFRHFNYFHEGVNVSSNKVVWSEGRGGVRGVFVRTFGRGEGTKLTLFWG